MSTLLILAALAGFASVPANAQSVIAGLNTSSNSSPFGSTVNIGEYQQIYVASDFVGPLSISTIAFASTPAPGFLHDPGTVTYGFTVGLATSATSLANPSSSYAANKGADFTTVFDGTLTASLLNAGVFDLVIPTRTPFVYNPASGDLLLDVVLHSSSGSGGHAFLAAPDSGVSPTVSGTSRVFIPSGTRNPTTQPGGGLYTRFDAAVPEPSQLALFALSLLPLGLVARRRLARKDA